MTHIPNLTLNDGHTIPQLGFGVFQVPPEDTAEITGQAFEAGCRRTGRALPANKNDVRRKRS